jgi:hypothetical protein
VTVKDPVPFLGPTVYVGEPRGGDQVVCWVSMVIWYLPPLVGVGIGNTATLFIKFWE